MKTIRLQVGDILRALKDEPFGIPVGEGQLLTIVGFGGQNDARAPKKFNECAPKLQCNISRYNSDIEWCTNVKELFHNFAKETK